MQSGADKMKAELDSAAFSEPRTPVYSNVTAALHADVHRSNSGLSSRLFPREVGADDEIADRRRRRHGAICRTGSNRHLAGLAKRINRRLPIESLAQMPAETAK